MHHFGHALFPNYLHTLLSEGGVFMLAWITLLIQALKSAK